MESCESAALSRDLKTRQRLELVRSEKLTKMGGIMVWRLILPDMAGSSSWLWKTCQSGGGRGPEYWTIRVAGQSFETFDLFKFTLSGFAVAVAHIARSVAADQADRHARSV